jgi:hypothetical protein
MTVNRKLRKVEQMSDGVSDYYDCEACLWPGIVVPKGGEHEAQREFDAHFCEDHPIPHKLEPHG